MSAAPPPNWYPDPHDSAQLRWWDGSKWTEHLHALVPDTPVTDDSGRTEADVPETQPVATTQQSTPMAERSVFDQWESGETPEHDVLRPFSEPPQQEPIAADRAAPSVGVPGPITPSGPGAPTSKNRRAVVIAAAIAVLVVVAVAFLATRDGDDEGGLVSQASTTTIATATTSSPATTASPGSTSTTTTPGTSAAPTTATNALAGTTFTDPTNVYRLRVAPAWQDATVTGGLQTWSTGTSSSVFRDSVNVLVEKLPGDISMDDYLAASVRNAPKSLPSFVEIGRSVNTVDGKLIGQLDFRSNQNIPLRHRAVVIIKERNAVVVTYTTEPARFDAESSKVQPYLMSVEGV